MRIRWYGQSAFLLESNKGSIFIDPFGDMSALAGRGMRFDFPAIQDAHADLLLITHEHLDHNVDSVVSGVQQTIRSTAGTFSTAFGQVVAIASEHDDVAGTQRGPNTIFVFDFDGLRIAHLGDFGQSDLRPEQEAAMGHVDLLFAPVGAGPTIGAAKAADIARRTHARIVVPMHYRTPQIGFLEPIDAFLQAFSGCRRLSTPVIESADLEGGPIRGVVPAPPSV